MTEESAAVLVVEDDTQLADLYGEFIPDTFSTGIAYSAEEAIDRLEPALDVLILDRELNNRNASDVLDYATSNSIDCQVIIVSGYDESTTDGIEYNAYLQKPVSGAELVRTLKVVLDSRRDRAVPVDSSQ